MIPSRLRRLPWGPILLLALVVLVVAACATAAPGASGAEPGARPPTPHPPLTPAKPNADPLSLLAWLFNPIFQTMLIILIGVYSFLESLGVPAAIGWAIVVLTLVVRTVVIPLYRRQLDLAAADAAPAARDQGDPEALQGRRHEGPRRAAGALQGARREPAGRLPAAAAPDAAAVHHVLGHPERADERRPDRDADGLRAPDRPADLQQPERRRRARTRRSARASTRSSRSSAASTSASRRTCSRSSASG